MYTKFRAVLLSTLAMASLTVVTAPAAHAAGYTQVGYATAVGRQVYLWRNNDNYCIHAQGKSLRTGDQVLLSTDNGKETWVTADRMGVSRDTSAICDRGGVGYRGTVLVPNGNGPVTYKYTNY